MAKYTHSKTAIVRNIEDLRTRKRDASKFKTAERIFSTLFPAFGAPLGVSYDDILITKTNRNPSVG